MKIDLLFFDGCPSYLDTRALLDQVLVEEHVEPAITMIHVVDEAEATANRFAGSPTLRVDSQDLFPDQMPSGYGIQCRVYNTPHGYRGTPTKEMLRTALKRRMTQE